MGINFDVTAATAILKNRYTKKKIETLAFMSPTLAKMPKEGSYGGALYVGAIRNAVTSSVSASDSVAFTTGSPSVYNQWQCAWKYGYASGNITGSAIDQAKGDANALVDGLTSEFDGAFIALGIKLGGDLFGNGGGAIGKIDGASNVATTLVTLKTPSQIVNFYVGQILQASVDDGTGGAGVYGGTVTITQVDVNAGTLTASGNWSAGIASITNNSYLFPQGNYAASIIGFDGWIPDPSISTSNALYTSFNSVNRNTDPVRLAGVRYSGNGAPKSETLIQLATLVNRMGGRPNYCAVNPLDYSDIVKELGTRATITTVEAYKNPQIGFPGVKVATPYGTFDLAPDVFCPQGLTWLLNMDEWLMPSMGDVPKVLGTGIDGMEWLRVAGADAYQMRAGFRASTYCAAPGHQGVGAF